MALDEQRLRTIGELFRGDGGPLRERQEFRAGNVRGRKFVGLAHVDEAGRKGAGEPGLCFHDRDLGNSHVDQFVIETGVPTLTFSKNFWAMKPGMRMQPCEAG